MRAIVTGGAGFIGSNLVDALVRSGVDVHLVDDLATGSRENLPDAAELQEPDIRDEELERLAAQLRPDVISRTASPRRGTGRARASDPP